MQRSKNDVWVGLFVLIGLAAVLFLALKSANLGRADIGATQNRLEATLLNIESNANNLVASRSRITDADFAAETTELSRSQVLGQAAQAMLAQANQAGQQVLQLLR